MSTIPFLPLRPGLGARPTPVLPVVSKTGGNTPSVSALVATAQILVAALSADPNYCVDAGIAGSAVNVALRDFKVMWNAALASNQLPAGAVGLPVGTGQYDAATQAALLQVLGSIATPAACSGGVGVPANTLNGWIPISARQVPQDVIQQITGVIPVQRAWVAAPALPSAAQWGPYFSSNALWYCYAAGAPYQWYVSAQNAYQVSGTTPPPGPPPPPVVSPPIPTRPQPLRPFPLAGVAGRGDDCNCEAEIPLDPRVYAAVQWDLSQFNCPGCGRLGLPLMAFSPSIKPPPAGCTKYCTVDDRGKIVCFDDCPPRTLAGVPSMNQMTVPAFLRPGFLGAARGPRGLGAATDVFSGLTAAQQAWVLTTLAAWYASASTQAWYNVNSASCPGVSSNMDLTQAANRAALVACFQAYTNAQGQSSLNTAGTLDSNTLSALIAWNGAAGGAACPGNCAGAAPSSTSSSTTYWVVGGIAVAALIGGVWYATSRSHRGRGAAQAYEGAY